MSKIEKSNILKSLEENLTKLNAENIRAYSASHVSKTIDKTIKEALSDYAVKEINVLVDDLLYFSSKMAIETCYEFIPELKHSPEAIKAITQSTAIAGQYLKDTFNTACRGPLGMLQERVCVTLTQLISETMVSVQSNRLSTLLLEAGNEPSKKK